MKRFGCSATSTRALRSDRKTKTSATTGALCRARCMTQIVEQYPLSPRAQDAKVRLKQMGLPVPASNPDALIRMQKERDYERQHHESALMKAPKDMIHGAPDVSLAAHNGQPNLNPPDDAVAASEVLKPNSGGGFSLSGSASSGGSADVSATASSGGATKQTDTPAPQAIVETGPGGGTVLGVPIIPPREANASSGGTSTNPPAAGSEQPAPAVAPVQPAANAPDSSGTAPAATPPSGAASSAPAASNGQPAGSPAPTQADQSAADSSSSSSGSQTSTPAQSSSSDDSKDSTSKKKKGARKLIPW